MCNILGSFTDVAAMGCVYCGFIIVVGVLNIFGERSIMIKRRGGEQSLNRIICST